MSSRPPLSFLQTLPSPSLTVLATFSSRLCLLLFSSILSHSARFFLHFFPPSVSYLPFALTYDSFLFCKHTRSASPSERYFCCSSMDLKRSSELPNNLVNVKLRDMFTSYLWTSERLPNYLCSFGLCGCQILL
jgi:hypothetical protein